MDRMTVQTKKFEMQNNILPFQNTAHQKRLAPCEANNSSVSEEMRHLL
jgi:hypothetical protein